MPTDYTQKEREFLDSLEPNTGKNLSAWLTAIAQQGLEDRNAIIDWLRQHGLTSSNASWLERIYHNGGQPIYGHDASPDVKAPVSDPHSQSTKTPPGVDSQSSVSVRSSKSEKARPSLQSPEVRPVTLKNAVPISEAPDSAAFATELAKAKGLRPLAVHLLRTITTVAPGTRVSTKESGLVFAENGTIYGVLDLAATSLRLALILPDEVAKPPFHAPTQAKAGPIVMSGVTHVLKVDDVRQLDDAVIAQIARAAKSTGCGL